MAPKTEQKPQQKGCSRFSCDLSVQRKNEGQTERQSVGLHCGWVLSSVHYKMFLQAVDEFAVNQLGLICLQIQAVAVIESSHLPLTPGGSPGIFQEIIISPSRVCAVADGHYGMVESAEGGVTVAIVVHSGRVEEERVQRGIDGHTYRADIFDSRC